MFSKKLMPLFGRSICDPLVLSLACIYGDLHCMDTIFRNDVLLQMDTGDPFDLVFITADRSRGTGGSIRRISGWQKVVNTSSENGNRSGAAVIKARKNPNHREKKTVNIFNPNDPHGHAVKVHWRLMVFFNGKRILQ